MTQRRSLKPSNTIRWRSSLGHVPPPTADPETPLPLHFTCQICTGNASADQKQQRGHVRQTCQGTAQQSQAVSVTLLVLYHPAKPPSSGPAGNQFNPQQAACVTLGVSLRHYSRQSSMYPAITVIPSGLHKPTCTSRGVCPPLTFPTVAQQRRAVH